MPERTRKFCKKQPCEENSGGSQGMSLSTATPCYDEVASFTSRPPHLFLPPNHDSPNLHIIISIGSGVGGARQFFDTILKATLERLGLDKRTYQLHETESEVYVTELSRTIFLPRANQGVAQTILLLSGDGGIVDIINVLLSSLPSGSYVKPAIGLLAFGTGNALANSTGLTPVSSTGLQTLLKGKPVSLPTFSVKFSSGSRFVADEGKSVAPLLRSDEGHGLVYGAVVFSWALHASLVAESDTFEYRKYGAGRFKMAAQELLSPPDGSAPHNYKGKITIFKKSLGEHKEIVTLDRREHMYILASLVSNLEEKLRISPHSKPLDGQLRLVHFRPLSNTKVMRIFELAYQGGLHIDDADVQYDDIDGLRIDFEEPDDRWRRVCIDGKVVRVNEGGWVEIRKERRNVIDIIVDLEN